MTARRGVVAAVALGLFASAIGLQIVRDHLYHADAQAASRLLYFTSASQARRAALAFQALAADLYWIRAIQHYGGDRLNAARAHRYELLAPLLDLTTALDPYFTVAYRFGAIFLAEPPPGGPGRPDQAIALLEKGISTQPERWEYYHDIAFVHYWRLEDPATAAVWFRRASEQPGAPNWLAPVAANMVVEGGDRRAARFLWLQLLESDEEWLQRSARRSLQQLDALDAIDALQAALRATPPPAGVAYTWDWAVQRRIVSRTPTDPTGASFDLDPATGFVSLSSTSPLYPLPGQLPRSAR